MGMGSPPCIKILASGEMDSSGWAFGAGEVGWLLLATISGDCKFIGQN